MEAAIQTSLYEQEFIEFITSQPSLEQMSTYRLSDAAEARLGMLLEHNRQGTLTSEMAVELKAYDKLEHIMTMMKLRAVEKSQS